MYVRDPHSFACTHKKTILPGLAQCAQSYHDKYGLKTDKMAFLPSQTLQCHSHPVHCSVHSYTFRLKLVKAIWLDTKVFIHPTSHVREVQAAPGAPALHTHTYRHAHITWQDVLFLHQDDAKHKLLNHRVEIWQQGMVGIEIENGQESDEMKV